MNDLHATAQPLTTASKVAEHLGGRLFGQDAPLYGVCTLANPRPGCLAFVNAAKPEMISDLALCKTGLVLLVPEGVAGLFPGCHIAVASPRQAFAVALSTFFLPRSVAGIAATARIAADAILGSNVTVGEYAVIGPKTRIGANSVIRHHVVIGERVIIGENCLIKSGSIIGEEGFGIDKDKFGNNIRIPHIGSVVIGDNVEIGSLNTVCSGTIDPTLIYDYVKTDDHVHIAHNCTVGENTIVTACAEISGSVTIGKNAWLGPNCSIINGITIGDGAFVGLGAVVTKSCEGNSVYAGVPAKFIRKNTQ